MKKRAKPKATAKAAAQPAAKIGRNGRAYVPQPHGGALLPGVNGGNNGGGRPPDAWKAEMRGLRDRWLVTAKAKDILGKPDHPAWLGAAKFVHEAVDGKPDQKHDMTSGGRSLAELINLGQELEAKRTT